MISDRIYSKDSKGVLRFWQFEVEGHLWRGISGQVGGAVVESGWTICVPKSKSTAEEQAVFEAYAEEKKKLDRKYRRTVEDLEKGDIFIQPMLAHGVDDYDMPLPYYAQPKLDGFRCVMVEGEATTRQGKKYVTVNHVINALEPVFAAYPELTLDGELYNHDFKDDFNTLSSLIRKDFKLDKKALKAGITEEQQRAALADKQASAIQYHVYDIIDPTMACEDRIAMLERIFHEEFDIPFIHVVETVEVTTADGADRLYEEWLGLGYEGLMKRAKRALYQIGKRSKDLLKWKDFETKEFKLLRIEEGNGNWSGLAKRVVVELEDGTENEAGIRGNMEKAKELLDNRDEYEGGEVTIRFMRQRTPDGKLRAPVAIDFHPEGRKD